MPKLTPKHFSFNSHLGACPACHGIGTELFFDSELMVDSTKTLDQGAIKPWRVGHKRMRQYYGAILQGLIEDTPVAGRCAVQGSSGALPSRCCFSEVAIGRSPFRFPPSGRSPNPSRVWSRKCNGYVRDQRKRVHKEAPARFSGSPRLRRLRVARACARKFSP